MSKILFSYPTPDKNPSCICPHLGASFFCPFGHLTECHSGFRCGEARCSHLPQYDEDFGAYETQNAPAWAVLILKEGKVLGYPNIVFAPLAEMAEEAVRNWIPQTENLSQIADLLKFEVRSATPEDFAKFEKLKAEYV